MVHVPTPPASAAFVSAPQTSVARVTAPQTRVARVTDPQTSVAHVTDPQTGVAHVTDPQTSVARVTAPQTSVAHVTALQTSVTRASTPHTSVARVIAPQTSVARVTALQTSVARVTAPQTSVARVSAPHTSDAPVQCIPLPDSEDDARAQEDDRECQQLLQEPTIKQRLQPLYSQLFALVERNSALVQKLRQHHFSTLTEKQQQHTVHVSMDPHVILAGTTLSKLQQCFNARIITSKNGKWSLAFFNLDEINMH